MPRALLFYTMLALQIGTALAAEPKQVQREGARFVGAAGCKSSSCHGGAGEKRSQYITWLREDVHTRGYAILTNARSDRMAQALELPQTREGQPPATASARCTVCHSPFAAIPHAQQRTAADPTESVSCESCHGAAGAWLRGHTRPDWTYATRVGAGMRDLKSFYVRANTCVACHQNLDSDIAAAGHPDLIFELNRQSIAQPKHWRDPEQSDVRAWLVGQAVALREASWKLSQNPSANEQTLEQWHGLVWLLAKVTATDRSLLSIDPPSAAIDAGAFTRIQQQADALARRAAQQDFQEPFALRLAHELAATGPEFLETADITRKILFRRAQRLVLALESLTTTKEAASEPLALLREDLRSPVNFQPAEFAMHLSRLRDSLPPAAP